MKRLVIALIFIINTGICFSQSQPSFKLTIHENSNWSLKIDTITQKSFNSSKKNSSNHRRINSDSLLIAITRDFPQTVVMTDSCLIFKGISKTFSICKHKAKDDSSAKGYLATDFRNGYLIIEEWEYESWYYLSFNPVTKIFVATANDPIFINDQLVFSVGNYYGEGQFQIIDQENNKYFGFDNFGWEIIGFYREVNSIYMEHRKGSRYKYLRITY